MASFFAHRVYLGWITDLATQPDPTADWPSLRLDARLQEDYQHAFARIRELGFHAAAIWGLYVGRSWPTNIEKSVPADRGRKVEQLIAAAHQQKIRVYAGLGVYSWGFEKIIQANPQLAAGNPRAMCASEPAAWEWMRRVTDFVFTRFDIDGVSLQSADQGRCTCAQCRKYTDAEYHALLNIRTATYIRSRWPGKTIGVNSWGMHFDRPENLPSLVEIGRNVDYLIDVHDTSRRADPAYRRILIQALACDFGTLGGPQVEPPQHWPRDRWLLPTLQSAGEHIGALRRDGGRACEYFFHLTTNPGDELSLWVAGKMLADPDTSWQEHLQQSVAALYRVRETTTRDQLADLFLRAENAYLRHLPPRICGTISLEPLESDHAGAPVYLTERLNPTQRAAYHQDLSKILQNAQELLPEIPNQEKMHRVVRCLENTLRDLASISG